MTAALSVTCLGCRDGWWHCHGTWLVEPDGQWCSDDPDCGLPPEAHDHVEVVAARLAPL